MRQVGTLIILLALDDDRSLSDLQGYGGEFTFGFVFSAVAGAHSRERVISLSLCDLELSHCSNFSMLVRNGMVSCAAPKQSHKLFSSVRYRVARASGRNPVAKKRGISMY